MARTHHAEVGAIRAGDLDDAEPLCDGDHGGVGDAHRPVDVGIGQFSHALVVGDGDLDRLESPVGTSDEVDLRIVASANHVARLGDDRGRHEQATLRETQPGQQGDAGVGDAGRWCSHGDDRAGVVKDHRSVAPKALKMLGVG